MYLLRSVGMEILFLREKLMEQFSKRGEIIKGCGFDSEIGHRAFITQRGFSGNKSNYRPFCKK